MPKKRDDFCELCPKKLGVDCPSPMALERMHEVQYTTATSKNRKCSTEETPVGCDWYIYSSEHNYCFWNYASTIDSPVPDKEICLLLGISQTQLREIYSSAIKSLRQNIGDPAVAEFIEIMFSKIRNRDIGPEENFTLRESSSMKSTDEVEEEMDSILAKFKKGKRKKIKNGMPIHRDGKKVDLFGLSSKKKRKE